MVLMKYQGHHFSAWQISPFGYVPKLGCHASIKASVMLAAPVYRGLFGSQEMVPDIFNFDVFVPRIPLAWRFCYTKNSAFTAYQKIHENWEMFRPEKKKIQKCQCFYGFYQNFNQHAGFVYQKKRVLYQRFFPKKYTKTVFLYQKTCLYINKIQK